MADVYNIEENDITAAVIASLNKPVEGRPEGYKTVNELIDETGFGKDKIREQLRQWQKEDRLTVIHVRVIGIDGRRYPCPAYGIKPE